MKKFILFMTCMAFFATANSGYTFTKNDAQSMVQKAIAFYNANGKAATFQAISNPKGQFRNGELYVFTYDLKGVVTSHPATASLIGKNVYNLKDTNGFQFVKYMVDNSKTKGSGWCEYMWKNPETNKIAKKYSYFQMVGDIIFVCGIY